MKQQADMSGVHYGPVRAVVVTILLFFASQFLGAIIISIIAGLVTPNVDDISSLLEQSASWQFGYVLLAEATAIGLLYWFLKRYKTAWSSIGWVKPRLRDVGYALSGFGVYFLVYVLAIFSLVKHYFPQINTEQQQDIGFSLGVSGVDLAFVFLSLVILPPLVEEILVRGFLFTGLKAKMRLLPAALITSVLFAAAHLQWGSGNSLLWVAAIDTFVLSLVLVWVRHKTGSLWPGIGLHFIKNGIAFLALFIFKVT